MFASARSRLSSLSSLASPRFSSTAAPKSPTNPVGWYLHQLETRPLITKACTSGVIAGGGDITCQLIVHKHSGTTDNFFLDKVRVARFGFLGLVWIGPVSHFWYGFVMRVLPGSGVLVNVKRVILDQGGFAPLFIPSMFMSSKLLEGYSFDAALVDLKASFLEIYKSNLVLWPAAMAFNFGLVPPQFQVLFSNAVGLIWNSYMSFMANDNVVEKEEKGSE